MCGETIAGFGGGGKKGPPTPRGAAGQFLQQQRQVEVSR